MCTALAVAGVPAVLAALLLVREGAGSPLFLPLALVAGCATVLVVLMDLRYGLALFIVAAGISPKLPGVYDNLRIEDPIFLLVFFLWVLRMAQSGRMPQLRSPIVLPFLVLTGISVISTVYGVVLGVVPDLKYSVLLQVKRVEYFLIFVVVATTVRSEAWLRVLTVLFVASGALAAGYGLLHTEDAAGMSVADKRVMGPEGEHYNTLAGYLVICISAGLAVLPSFKRGGSRWLLLAAVGLAAAGLLLSFSREGYIMFGGALLVFGLTRHRLILVGAVVALAAVFLVAEPVRENVALTARTIQEAPGGDVGANSLSARFSAWEWRLNGWFLKQPIMGNGVGSVGLSVDNEYVLRLCEVGLIGFGAFLWWLLSIGQQVRRLQRSRGLSHSLAIAVAASFVGLLIQGMAAASFNSIRTMEPFWYLLGLVTAAVLIGRGQALASTSSESAPVGENARCRASVHAAGLPKLGMAAENSVL